MLYPMFTLMVFTFLVACYLLMLRILTIKNKAVKLSLFKLNNAEDTPDRLLQAARNYSNLFEVPVFFYAAGCVCLALQISSPAIMNLAWVFVASRVVHSAIHLTNNNVVTRLGAFLVSFLSVMAIWVLIMLNQA